MVMQEIKERLQAGTTREELVAQGYVDRTVRAVIAYLKRQEKKRGLVVDGALVDMPGEQAEESAVGADGKRTAAVGVVRATPPLRSYPLHPAILLRYEAWVDHGYDGTFSEWMNELSEFLTRFQGYLPKGYFFSEERDGTTKS